MKIVVLDGYATNPGDLSWDWLYALGDTIIYDRTEESELLAHAADADILVNNKTPLRRETLLELPRLKYVALLSTGYNIIDGKAAKEKGILVSNIPEYSTQAVAQMVFAFILHFYNQVSLHNCAVHQGEWNNCRDFCFWKTPLLELSGKTMGILGYGKIGRQVGRLASAFEMKVRCYSRSLAPGTSLEDGALAVELDELLATSDILSLHCPLTADTRNLIDQKALSKMKAGALLINTSRGPVIDEQALLWALQEGKLGGACLDVLSKEPPCADHPLLRVPNCIITPHIAWAGLETRRRLLSIAEKNIVSYLSGSPQNLVHFS